MSSSKSKPIHKNGPARLQPIRATQPFQLLQGSPARKSPCSSPTPRPTPDARVVNVRSRWSPDHRSSPDRGDRKSPSSPSIKVSSRRSPSPSIRRTSSLDTIAGPYLTGQWPRDGVSHLQHSLSQYMRDKTTQTPVDWSIEISCQQLQQVKVNGKNSSGRTSSIADSDLKQLRQPFRRISKSSRHGDKKERSPPVHGNHAALHQLSGPRPLSTPVTIGGQPFGRSPRRQNSTEALNKEIELLNTTNTGNEPRAFQGITPPDGHRAPIPRSSTRSMETQTPQEYSLEGSDCSHGSQTPSPTIDQATSSLPSRNAADADAKDSGISPCPKYASSPRPNNSYMFKREPPEGAESVKPFREQETLQASPSCPDKNKVNFVPRISSAFVPALKSNSNQGSSIQQAATQQIIPDTLTNKESLHTSASPTNPMVNLAANLRASPELAPVASG